MRIGSTVFATEQGLGYLAKSFYDNGIVTDVAVIKHRKYPMQNWYPKAPVCEVNSLEQLKQFASGMQAMLFFETPFNWELIPWCRQQGIKTVLMPMYECTPSTLPEQPDYFICPSLLDLRFFPSRSSFIQVPVDVRWKKRSKATTFVHNAGHGGLMGRNGTQELLDAMRYVKSPITLILRSQDPLFNTISDSRIVMVGSVPYDELWDTGDVFIFPEKFNGLSLPLQEARAAGMLVMSSNRFPTNTWLPSECLIPIHAYRRNKVGARFLEFDEAVVRPLDIANTIDQWYEADISDYSEAGYLWSQSMSWEQLTPKYLDTISNVELL